MKTRPIAAQKFTSPIVQSPDREGLPEKETIVDSEQVIATLNFGDKLGVFDFTSDQYWSFVRGKRVLVRGERGEIIDDRAVYLQDYATPIVVNFTRHEAGQHGSMDGHYLKGIQVGEAWIYRNPIGPAPVHDDDIAVGDCMLKMAEYADGGAAFYPLAEACQDRYLDIMIRQAVDTGQPVTTETQVWAD